MQQNGWATVSNFGAILAAVCPMAYLVLPRNDMYAARYTAAITCLCLLLFSYLAARQIKDCKVPFLRVAFIWCFWTFSLVGLVAPLALLLREMPLFVVWPPVFYSLPFAAGAYGAWRSMLNVSANDT